MKHSYYDVPELLPFSILNPILTELLGSCNFDGGHYLDAHWPFVGHFDTKEAFDTRMVYRHGQNTSTTGVIIPFVEHSKFSTIFFDLFFNSTNNGSIHHCSNNPNSPELMELLDHHSQKDLDVLRYIPITAVAEWKIGRIIIWPRHQLHCSSNFGKHGLTKQGLVLWI